MKGRAWFFPVFDCLMATFALTVLAFFAYHSFLVWLEAREAGITSNVGSDWHFLGALLTLLVVSFFYKKTRSKHREWFPFVTFVCAVMSLVSFSYVAFQVIGIWPRIWAASLEPNWVPFAVMVPIALSLKILGFALDAYVDLGQFLCKKGTPTLGYAARIGDSSEVQRMIELGADIERTDRFGATPLMLAAQGGHWECVELLIQDGANVFKKNDARQSASDVAREQGHEALVMRLSDHIHDLDERERLG